LEQIKEIKHKNWVIKLLTSGRLPDSQSMLAVYHNIYTCICTVYIVKIHFKKHTQKANRKNDRATEVQDIILKTINHNFMMSRVPRNKRKWNLMSCRH